MGVGVGAGAGVGGPPLDAGGFGTLVVSDVEIGVNAAQKSPKTSGITGRAETGESVAIRLATVIASVKTVRQGSDWQIRFSCIIALRAACMSVIVSPLNISGCFWTSAEIGSIAFQQAAPLGSGFTGSLAIASASVMSLFKSAVILARKSATTLDWIGVPSAFVPLRPSGSIGSGIGSFGLAGKSFASIRRSAGVYFGPATAGPLIANASATATAPIILARRLQAATCATNSRRPRDIALGETPKCDVPIIGYPCKTGGYR